MPPALEGLDNDHMAAAAWAWRAQVHQLLGAGFFRLGCDVKQITSKGQAGLATGAGEQAIMPDPMEAARQDMGQEPPDELVSGDSHDALAISPILAVILVAQGDVGPIEGKDPPVRYRDPMRIARQIGQHRFRSCERRFGIDDPALLTDGSEVTQERPAFAQRRERSEEGELPGIVELGQPGQEQPAEQLAQNPDRQEEGGTRGYPSFPAWRDAPPGTIMCTCG